MPEIPDMAIGFPIVLAANREGRHLRLIDVRLDLHPTISTFEWGYAGAGPKFTAWCILAHYFGNVPPTSAQVANLVEHLLGRLNREDDHEITVRQIDDALQRIDPHLREFLDQTKG